MPPVAVAMTSHCLRHRRHPGSGHHHWFVAWPLGGRGSWLAAVKRRRKRSRPGPGRAGRRRRRGTSRRRMRSRAAGGSGRRGCAGVGGVWATACPSCCRWRGRSGAPRWAGGRRRRAVAWPEWRWVSGGRGRSACPTPGARAVGCPRAAC